MTFSFLRVIQAFSSILDQMKGLEDEVPLVRSHVAKFAARAVIDNIINLAELSEPMENGNHYPLFMLCLQQMTKLQDKDWLYKIFTDSKLHLQNMLPGTRTCGLLEGK